MHSVAVDQVSNNKSPPWSMQHYRNKKGGSKVAEDGDDVPTSMAPNPCTIQRHVCTSTIGTSQHSSPPHVVCMGVKMSTGSMKKMKSEHDSSPPRTTAATTAATEPPPHLLDSSSSSSSSVDIRQLKLEAIFHPKFDNENSSDLVIRNTMLRNVANNAGYIEVSLKHSGSLLLWSGKQYYYSKNSTFNSFTKVGEILLLQHFARCHSHHHHRSSGSSSHGSSDWKMEYEKCSDYIYNNRLTCSFEIVTSILGHHGDIPNKDYLILIAVAYRGYDYSGGGGGGGGSIENASKRPRFYTTNELIKFAQTYRLPHNDTWLFGSRV